MPGGASTRRYFRVRHAGATAVAMFVPEGAKAEEIAKPGEHARWPFLEVRDLLAARGVDVPAVYGEDTPRGWLLLEDLGDDTLAAYLTLHPGKKGSLYVRAVEDLARAQASLADLPPARPGPARTEMLSCVSNFNFDWSVTYPYADDVTPLLPAGTIIHIISWHDNTSANKHNPDPNTWLGFGPRSIDDMSFSWISLTYLDQSDFDQRVAARQTAKAARGGFR